MNVPGRLCLQACGLYIGSIAGECLESSIADPDLAGLNGKIHARVPDTACFDEEGCET